MRLKYDKDAKTRTVGWGRDYIRDKPIGTSGYQDNLQVWRMSG